MLLFESLEFIEWEECLLSLETLEGIRWLADVIEGNFRKSASGFLVLDHPYWSVKLIFLRLSDIDECEWCNEGS